MCKCLHVYVNIYIYIYIYIFIYLLIYLFILFFLFTYVYIYIYTHGPYCTNTLLYEFACFKVYASQENVICTYIYMCVWCEVYMRVYIST